ncbi:MAG: class I SAM-dependent methyltransferase [Acidimicrobiales bacterium]
MGDDREPVVTPAPPAPGVAGAAPRPPEIVNVEQAQEWDTTEGEHWVAHQERYDAMLAPFLDPLLDAAGLTRDATALDVGCGCGVTTRAAAKRAAAGAAVGVDLSGPMLALARQLAAEEGLGNVSYEQADAQVHPFEPAGFDAVISRFGVMFFADPVAAFANIRTALRPAGRLVFTCWRPAVDNEWIMVPAGAALQHVPLPDLGDDSQPGPFTLGRRERIAEVLDAAGFEAVSVDPVDAPLRLGADAEDTVEFIRGTSLAQELIGQVAPDVAQRALAAIADALGAFEADAGVVLGSAAWLVIAGNGEPDAR